MDFIPYNSRRTYHKSPFGAVREGEKYHLRWFTPGGEIDLCGHATLGTACAIMTFVEPEHTQITFSTLSGDLTVVRCGVRPQ